MFNLDRHIKKITLEAMSPRFIDLVKNRVEPLPFNNLFGKDKLRIVIPFEDRDFLDIRNNRVFLSIHNLLSSGKTTTGKNYVVDFKKDLAYEIINTERGKKTRTYRLGKIIMMELGIAWANKYSMTIQGKHNTSSDHAIIISRSPIDILRMSDYTGIESCHSEGQGHFEDAQVEALSGGLIAYVINKEDLKSVSDWETKEEIFRDDRRNVEGIYPLSRISIHRYRYGAEEGDPEVAVPIPKQYPKNHSPIIGFYDNIKKWLHDNQRKNISEFGLEKLYKESYNEDDDNEDDEILDPRIMEQFFRVGRDYEDLTDKEIFDSFFANNRSVFPDEKIRVVSESKSEIWEAEINEIIKDSRSELTNCSISGSVESEDDYVRINCSIYVDFKFPLSFKSAYKGFSNEQVERAVKIFLGGKVGVGYDKKEYVSDEDLNFVKEMLCDDFKCDSNGARVEVENGVLNVSLYADLSVENPSRVAVVAVELKHFEKNKYETCRLAIAEFLFENKMVDEKEYKADPNYSKIKNFTFENMLVTELIDMSIDVTTKPYLIYIIDINNFKKYGNEAMEAVNYIYGNNDHYLKNVVSQQFMYYKQNILKAIMNNVFNIGSRVSKNDEQINLNWYNRSEEFPEFENSQDNGLDTIKSRIISNIFTNGNINRVGDNITLYYDCNIGYPNVIMGEWNNHTLDASVIYDILSTIDKSYDNILVQSSASINKSIGIFESNFVASTIAKAKVEKERKQNELPPPPSSINISP